MSGSEAGPGSTESKVLYWVLGGAFIIIAFFGGNAIIDIKQNTQDIAHLSGGIQRIDAELRGGIQRIDAELRYIRMSLSRISDKIGLVQTDADKEHASNRFSEAKRLSTSGDTVNGQSDAVR